VQSLADNLAELTPLNRVVVPDLWQQQAVGALRAGQDVVVHAPTGAGKTLVFELWSRQGRNRGQAIYTVPTRALANDKRAEWQALGWDVGIATGDLAENLEAPVLVATLETQKHRLIAGEGPELLVVDEYQMVADPDRGLNYELAIALAPERTQLLLLSGSVANPQDVVKWLRRLGRDAVLIRNDVRPVPLEEVHAEQLSYFVPGEIRGYWPRYLAKALAENLGPVLVFAPRRQAAESLAAELARYLPCPDPLALSPAQRQLVGDHLARLLKTRIAYHHSGLSYGARAGVIEPLAKAGQLRVVVATMGLAAGINFSLRSAALAGDSYRRDLLEQPLRCDEILQMFGRAGRRGIDETGYALVTANEIRLLDAHPAQITRNGMVDWAALLGIMRTAARQGREPFAEAVRVQERLFTARPIVLGIEESLRHPDVPCQLKTDPERARHVRRQVRELYNSRGEWEPWPALSEQPLQRVRVGPRAPAQPSGSPPTANIAPADLAAASAFSDVPPTPAGTSTPATTPTSTLTPAPDGASHPTAPSPDPTSTPTLRPALSDPEALERAGNGDLVVLEETNGVRIYGRALTVADRLPGDRLFMAKWVRRMTGWNGRQVPMALWRERVQPLLERRLAAQHTPLVRCIEAPDKIIVHLSLADWPLRVAVDRHGVPLWRPATREVLPPDCTVCPQVAVCRELPTATATALLWRRLGLIDADGRPTQRGELVSFFGQGDGLAIAAALEDPSYPIDEMAYDLACLDAGFRFCGEDNRWAGRLALACHQAYGLQSIPGYLENGMPPKYGAGAEPVVAAVHRDPSLRHEWITEWVGIGDIDRLIIEWRSLLRQVAHAPALEWPRWLALQARARALVGETKSPTLTDLPPLERHQTRRIEHRLLLRR
jgi:superfamily II DNA/RNA helicase